MKPAKLVNMRPNSNRNIPKHQIEVIITMYDGGASYTEISEATSVKYTTVKTIIRRNREIRRPNKDDISRVRQEVAMLRHTLYATEVAKRLGKSVKWVYWITKDCDDQEKFLKYHRKKAVRAIGKTQRFETKDRVPTDRGFAKLKKTEKIFETKQPKAMRSVPMYDNKNTIKFVDLDDPRSNEEIRRAWKEEQEKKLRSLASYPPNPNDKKKWHIKI